MKTPKPAPIRPPISKTPPILKSTFLRFKCARTPEKDEATIWFASVATATAGGIPMKNKSGVIRKPPPTPNMPDNTPTRPPNPRRIKALTETSAMGR